MTHITIKCDTLAFCFLSLMTLISHISNVANATTSCKVELISSGKDDPDSDQWEASIKLNGEYAFHRPYKTQTTIARGIHLGLLNVTSCELIDTPQQFDTYDSDIHNQPIADFIENFPLEQKEVMLVGVTGDNYGRNVNSVGITAFARLDLPEGWLINDRTSFAVFGRPDCEDVRSDYRDSGQGPVIITADFKVSSSVSNTGCAMTCITHTECASFSRTPGRCTLYTIPGQIYPQTTSQLLGKLDSCQPTKWYSRINE